MQKALDISKHQGTFNAQITKAQGISTVICRCAYGTSKDVRWDTFAHAVKAAGMELAAYGFLTAHYKSKNGGSFAQAQVLMRQQVSTWIGLCTQQGCKILAVDEELESPNTMGLTKADNTSLLIEACQMVEAVGLKPLIYCSASWAQGRIDTSRCKYPLWIAYYYADPNDPDFDGCKALEQVNTGYSRYMLGLGDQLYGWQFGRIGYGGKYGVGSDNVDKDWIYFQPDEDEKEELPVFTSDTLKIGPVSTGDRAAIRTLAESLAVAAVDDGDYIIVGPMSAGDRAAVSNKALALGLGCEDYTAPEEPEEPQGPEDKPQEPAVDLTEVLAALGRIESAQTEQGKQMAALLDKLAAAGAVLQ